MSDHSDLNVEREYDVDVRCSVTARDRHAQDLSNQSVRLLPHPQPGQLGQVGHPPGGEEESQVVSVVASQTLDYTAQISLHEDPGCHGVGTEPESKGKFETECFQICQ